MAPYEHSPTDPDADDRSESEAGDMEAPDLPVRLIDVGSSLDMSNIRDSLTAIGRPLRLSRFHTAAVPTPCTTRSIHDYYPRNMNIDLAATLANQQEIIHALEDIYRFFISIGFAEPADIAFGPHDLTHQHVKLLADSNFSPEAVAFFTMLPRPTAPISLDWNSQALRYFTDFDDTDASLRFLDLRTARECVNLPDNDLDELAWHEVPLTEYALDSLGFHWVINVHAGRLTRRYLRKQEGEEWENPYKGNSMRGGANANANANAEPSAQHKTDGDDDLLNWDGDAVQMLQEYLACLRKLEMIPVKSWAERSVSPGFVTQSESVYEDVKTKLLEYGWPGAFRRDEWVRDLPGLVRGWKYEKMRRLEVGE